MTLTGLSFDPDAPPPSPILIEDVAPSIDCGRYPVKREVGDVLEVSADIFREGHEKLDAVVRYRAWDEDDWREVPMRHIDNDRWAGSFPLERNTRYRYAVLAFPDDFESWRDEITKKRDAGLDVDLELREGMAIVEGMLTRATGDDHTRLSAAVSAARSAASQDDALAALLADDAISVAHRHRSREGAAVSVPELTVTVDRVAARFAAWYSMFPRSAGAIEDASATFADVEAHLPRIAAMGFDVLYFTPIHPISKTKRKGRNNSLTSVAGDPGVPYAIGSEEGGHDAIHAELGTVEDFRRLVMAAADHNIEIALDVALQGSPEHPWLSEHPEWFFARPDGTIKFGENPPKKYEDMYPLNFQSPSWVALWEEMRRIILHWVDLGVKTFRVDNPHTKPTVFWEWLITEVQRAHPDVIFLSEAFTRPKVMRTLAKAGFAQSYTYFTWRNFKQELTDYLLELTQSEMKEYFRGNFFTNTHDILPYILQEGGRPAFMSRVVLAGTLSSVYGIYSGFELCENTPVPGKEEYLNSEKYEYKVWDWDRPGNISDYIARLNQIRRDHPALQEYDNLAFLHADDDNVLCYVKALPERNSYVMVVVNLDPFQAHHANIEIPHHVLGSTPDDQIRATELLAGESYLWQGATQSVYLEPQTNPAMIFALRVWEHTAFAEPSF